MAQLSGEEDSIKGMCTWWQLAERKKEINLKYKITPKIQAFEHCYPQKANCGICHNRLWRMSRYIPCGRYMMLLQTSEIIIHCLLLLIIWKTGILYENFKREWCSQLKLHIPLPLQYFMNFFYADSVKIQASLMTSYCTQSAGC